MNKRARHRDGLEGVFLESALLHDWRALLDPGEASGSGEHALFDVVNPSSGALLARLPSLGGGAAEHAVRKAEQRFLEGEVPLSERLEWLNEIAGLLRAHREELARIITSEQGKPLAEARAEIDYAAGFFDFYSQHGAQIIAPRPVVAGRPPQPGALHWEVHWRPAGVVALITPWNFPLAMLAKKLAAALAAGCAVVVKPSELTPLTCIALFTLLRQVGEGALCGAGVRGAHSWVHLVFGDAPAIGAALCASKGVRLLSFTGSTATGRLLSTQAAPGLKRLALELGGNAPFIVFADADLDMAVKALVSNKFRCAGQTCVCTNRVYVATEVQARFMAKLVERVRALRVGDGFSPSSDFGPLINRAAFDKVVRHVADAIAKGATLELGGIPSISVATGEGEEAGFFYPATVLSGITSDMLVAREETFGPILSIGTFISEEEVLAEANGTPYGLAAYLFTASAARATRVVKSLAFGHVAVNSAAGPTPEAPFGGVKQSGYGREGGVEGLLEFCEAQSVATATG